MPRVLPPLVRSFLDAHVPVAALGAPGIVPPQVIITLCAQACVGIIEQGGDNHGPMVEAFQSTVGRPQSQPWCLDFVQTLLAYAEEKSGLKSPLGTSEGVYPFWMSAPVANRVTTLEPGDIVCWEHGETGKGHCGIYVGPVPGIEGLFRSVEGNTGPGGAIVREGDGVYLKTRRRGGSDAFHELGFLRAFL